MWDSRRKLFVNKRLFIAVHDVFQLNFRAGTINRILKIHDCLKNGPLNSPYQQVPNLLLPSGRIARFFFHSLQQIEFFFCCIATTLQQKRFVRGRHVVCISKHQNWMELCERASVWIDLHKICKWSRLKRSCEYPLLLNVHVRIHCVYFLSSITFSIIL